MKKEEFLKSFYVARITLLQKDLSVTVKRESKGGRY